MASPLTIPTLIFEDGSASSNASCNQYFGPYEIDGSSITFGQLASTQMFCGEPGVMDQEAAYLAALASVDTWSIDGEVLTLSSGDTALLRTRRSRRTSPAPRGTSSPTTTAPAGSSRR